MSLHWVLRKTRFFSLIVTQFIFLFSLSVSSFGVASTAVSGTVYLAQIRGSIDPGSADYFKKALLSASTAKAQFLLLELDTPGGLLTSVRDMAQAVDDSEIPVVVYVSPAGASATSAGALLMLASHFSAMAPGANIGAAHPVGPQGEDVKGNMGEKVVNDTVAFAKGLAEVRGRNAQIAELIVSKSKSLTSQEAFDQKLIELVVNSRHELIQELDQKELKSKKFSVKLSTKNVSVHEVHMTPGQSLLHFLANPNVSAILMSIGMLLIYTEISNPGLLFPGILGAICILVAFMTFQLLPVHTGGLVLLVLGSLLMLAEPFIVSKGALAVGGVISFVLGVLWLVDPSETSLVVSQKVWIPLALGLGVGIGLLAWAAARTMRLTRAALSKIGGGELSGLMGYLGHVENVSEGGNRGKIIIRGELWDFESEDRLEPGDPVTVTQVSGFKVFVNKGHEIKRGV